MYKVLDDVSSVFCDRTGLTIIPKTITNGIQFLDIANNSLTSIPVGVINHLLKLAFINMSSNGFHGDSIDTSALFLPHLKVLGIHVRHIQSKSVRQTCPSYTI